MSENVKPTTDVKRYTITYDGFPVHYVLEEDYARLRAEVEEWKQNEGLMFDRFKEVDGKLAEANSIIRKLADACTSAGKQIADKDIDLRTLRRSSVRVDVLLRWMFSAEPWNSPAVNWSILNRILIARSSRSTTNKKG